MEQIKVIIKKDGSLEYSVSGVKGATCKDLTKFIDQLGNVTSSDNSPEFYEVEETNQEEKN